MHDVVALAAAHDHAKWFERLTLENFAKCVGCHVIYYTMAAGEPGCTRFVWLIVRKIGFDKTEQTPIIGASV
jgi:hypothetical protein